jgi:hypothetical protein
MVEGEWEKDGGKRSGDIGVVHNGWKIYSGRTFPVCILVPDAFALVLGDGSQRIIWALTT